MNILIRNFVHFLIQYCEGARRMASVRMMATWKTAPHCIIHIIMLANSNSKSTLLATIAQYAQSYAAAH